MDVATTAPALITTDLPCMRCGYNLRTLGTDALCPECATPVAQSIELHSKSGQYNLRRLAMGAALLAAWGMGTDAIRLMPIHMYPLPTRADELLVIASDTILAVLLGAGAILIACSRPAMSVASRRAVIVLSIV